MDVKYPVKVSVTIQRKPKYDKERKSIVKMTENGRKHVSQVNIVFRFYMLHYKG